MIVTEDRVPELAQKLYSDKGYPGNIYKNASVEMLRYFENQAIEIKEREEEIRSH